MTTKQSIELCDLYREIISNVGMVADDDGFVSTQIAGSEKKPTLIKGKRLVLPTPEQLRTASAENSTIFHPLLENMMRGESDVVATFRNHFNKRLNFSIAYLMTSLLSLAIETNKHSKLSPEQSQFLSIVKEADEKTYSALEEISKKMMLDSSEESFIHTFVKKGGVVNQKKHSRVCVVSFPFYDELVKEPEARKPLTVMGVRLRKADRECLLGLIKFIIPDIDKPQTYWGISNSIIAPTMDCLVRTMSLIGTRINDVALTYSDFIEGVEHVMYDLDSLTIFDDLDSIYTQIKSIPMQLGNEGSIPQTAATTAVQGSTPPIGAMAPAPTTQVTSTPPWEAPQQTTLTSWNNPMNHNPMYPGQTQLPMIANQSSGGGVDVNQFFQRTPGLSMFGFQQQQPMMTNNQPVWARPFQSQSFGTNPNQSSIFGDIFV